MLEYEFPLAKQYSPKARTVTGGKHSLNRVFGLSNIVPKIWRIVWKVFMLTLNCCPAESTPVELPGCYNRYRTTIRLGKE